MTQVKMPTGEIVEMPDNPTPEQMRALAAINGTNQRQMASNPASAGGPMGLTDRFIRGTGLAVKGLAKGAAGTAGLVGDTLNSGINLGGELIGHNPHLGMPSAALNKGLEAIGLPHAQDTPERLAEFGGAMLGGSMLDPLSAALAAKYPPAKRQITQEEDAIQMARDQGYRLTPTQANGGPMGRVIEGLGGKKKITEAIAKYNAQNPQQGPNPPADIAQHVSDITDHMLRRSPLTGAAFVLGGPKAAAAMIAGPAIRAGARKLINSELGQRLFVDPKLSQPLLSNPALLRAYPAMIQNSPFSDQ